MKNILVQDVCEVLVKEKTLAGDGKLYFFGLTTKNDVTQKVKQEALKGGIGNGQIGLLQSDKEISFKVTTLLHNDDIYAIQSGNDFTDSTSITLQKTEEVRCASATELVIVGTPKGDVVNVMDADGKEISGTFAEGKVAITGGVIGALYTVVYPSDETGEVLLLDSEKFPKNYEVQLHTIAYDIDTNDVTADIYWIFNKALPNGAISAQYEAGKGNGDEVEFSAQLDKGSTLYGKYVVIPRT